MKKTNRIKTNLVKDILTIICSVLLSFFIGEGLIRLVFDVSSYKDRFLMWSSTHFTVDEYGAVKYIPNQKVRSVAVYNDKIEYDVQYRTNNLGLIDHRDYFENKFVNRRYAFVGDSFAAGIHGGEPWIPKLRDEINSSEGIEIYNLGVSGTSFENYFRILNSVSKQLSFTDIVIIAISHDFKRSYWRPVTSETEIRFCYEDDLEKCMELKPTAYIINFNSKISDILKLTQEIKRKEKKKDRKNGLIYQIRKMLKKSALLVYINEIRHYKDYNDLLEKNLIFLKNIVETFPNANISFIHLPMKEEVAKNKYNIDIKDRIEEICIDYYPALELYDWSVDMFHETDGHPNNYGYLNISKFVAHQLGFQLSVN